VKCKFPFFKLEALQGGGKPCSIFPKAAHKKSYGHRGEGKKASGRSKIWRRRKTWT